jgi:hypothetical protein
MDSSTEEVTSSIDQSLRTIPETTSFRSSLANQIDTMIAVMMDKHII